MEAINAGLDKPDKRDYKAKELFGKAEEEFPETYYDFPEIEIYNQGRSGPDYPLSKMCCSRAAMGHIQRMNDILEEEKTGIKLKQFDIFEFWKRAYTQNSNIIDNGDYLQNGLKQAKNEGLISGYYKVSTIDEIKSAIMKHHFIYTGSQYFSIKDGLFKTQSKKNGHIFCICGWNIDGLILLNSYGKDNGYRTIRWNEIPNLFTLYAVVDFTDQDAIDRFQCKKEILKNDIYYPFLNENHIAILKRSKDIFDFKRLFKRYVELDLKKEWVHD